MICQSIRQRTHIFTAILTTLAIVNFAAAAQAHGERKYDNILVEGVPLKGSANGMFFDAHNRLYVANVLGQSITVLDPDSGEILSKIGPQQGAFFVDDVTVAPDGSIYWTDFVLGLVNGLSPTGEPVSVAAGIPFANPITTSPDGRLFVGQCFGTTSNAIFELDPTGAAPPRVIFQDGPGCASNGFAFRDGALYGPRWFEGRVVRIDVETGALTTVTDNWPVPAAVKFDSRGRLYGVSHGTGEVVRINLRTGRRRVLTQLPIALDNLAIDSRDRIFVSSTADAFVVQVKRNGNVRVVSPGGLNAPFGLAVDNDKVTVGGLQTLRTYDRFSGAPLSTTTSIFGIGPFPGIPLAINPLDSDRFIVADWFNGELFVWNTVTQQAESAALAPAPVDAIAFQGKIAVSELGTGSVVLTSGPGATDRTVLASGLIVPAALAAFKDRDLYVSDNGSGQIFQIVRDRRVLPTPISLTDTPFNLPEGIALRSRRRLVVVEGGTNSLKQVNLRTGRVRTLVNDLGLRPPVLVPGLPPFGFLNHVKVDRKGSLYINGDGDNVIYKFDHKDLRRHR